MKSCHNCDAEKPLSEFNKNKSRKDGLATTCRECMKVLRKTHYESNKAKIVADVAARRQELIDKIWEYKSNSKCDDCGERNPIVLEFDHLGDKEFNVSAMPYQGYGWDRILNEIRKCDVVCSNCHRIRTHVRGGWVRNITVRV